MKKLSSLAILLIIFGHSFAQITKNIPKPDWNETESVLGLNELYMIQKPDIQTLLREDSIHASNKDLAWRFGYAIDQDIDFMLSADREVQNGLLRLSFSLSAQDAKSLNFNFSDFELSDNALLYISSLTEKDVIGALTQANNKLDRQFSSRPIKGNKVRIDLFTPLDEVDQNSIEISQIIYGYKDVFAKGAKTFNSSGSCNRNTNCPEALIWQDLVRSVVMITASNNTRLCTGTLINNVREDSTPYILTASHCNLATNSIFVFNYENSSINCLTNADGSLINSISGAFDRAESGISDFQLFELSQNPPASYAPYFAGWNANPQPAYNVTTIHHPSGDIKKISQDEDTLRSAFWVPQFQNTHWQVGNWDSGTTEPGSSGSSLFDQNKRIVGQLEGGAANCGNDLYDLFGKFSESWNSNPTSNRQLKFWLDPDTTNVLQMDGMDPLTKTNNQDVELTYVSNVPSFSCDTNINPVVHFLNRGNDTLRTLTIEYGLNQQYNQSFQWNGVLATDRIIEVSLPTMVLDSLDSNMVVRLILNPTDQDSSNNFWSKPIKLNVEPIAISSKFKSDQYGYESTWEIVDQQTQEVVQKGGPYVEAPNSNGIIYNESFCLFDGCFELRLFDAFGDGFTSQFFGNGYFVLFDQNGDTLVFEDNFTTAQKNINFCVSGNVGVKEELSRNIVFSAYPNPVRAGDRVVIRSEQNGPYQIQLYDLQGRILQESSANSISLEENLSPGVYIIQLIDQDKKIGRTKLLVR